MCLLEVLRELQKRLPFEIRAIHVHHGLRESAERDLNYVSDFCSKAEIPLKLVRVDAAKYASRNGLSLEEGARSLRYAALEQAATEWDQEAAQSNCSTEWDLEPALSPQTEPCRIAVAHHVEDQAETVLFNLVRGSRLTGVRGMLPVNGRIIRPLLGSRRPQIERFLTERGIDWCEDETNEDTTYTRNLLRREVIPLLEKINPKACEHLAGTAEEAAETEEFLSEKTQRALRRCRKQTSDSPHGPKDTCHTVLDIPSLLGEPPLLQRRVVYAVIAEAMGTRKDLQSVHVQDVLKVVRKAGNGEISLPGGVRAAKVYDELHVIAAAAQQASQAMDPPATAPAPLGFAARPASQAMDPPAAPAPPQACPPAQARPRRWPESEEKYRWRVLVFDGDMGAVPRIRCTKWFDYDKIGTFPIFRTRREGDRMTLDAEGRSKSIARMMIDEKVPPQERERIVLPTAGREVLWFPGGRISAAYMVEPTTERVLEITWDSEEQ